jgi:predicted RNase H-like HicB family nuclease
VGEYLRSSLSRIINSPMIKLTKPYTFKIFWSVEDQEFVATIVENPGVSWLAATPHEAFEGLQDLLNHIEKMMN